MGTLTPLTLKDQYYLSIEKHISALFYAVMYKPILEILQLRIQDIEKEIKNSKSALYDAIATGRVWYEDGEFKGSFNAKISADIIRLGGVFKVRSKSYSLPRRDLPANLKIAQANANSQYEALRTRILSAIDNMDVKNIDLMAGIQEQYEKTLGHMESDLQKTLPNQPPQTIDNPATAISRLVIEAKLTDEQKRIISEDWATNLELYIKGWTQNNILKLREQIQPHVMAGGRAQGLVKVIQDNYGVAQRKAKFLARQETALLMSKFQETRYRDMGIEKYRWSDSHDRRVRHDHHDLNGKIFRFDSPPVSNKKSRARNNPGQDFNCRCVAIPIFE